MALTKSFTDQSGNVCDSSYWRVTQIMISADDSRINLGFSAWKDNSSFQAGLSPLIGGTKQYSITGAEFAAVGAAAPVGSTLYTVLEHASETYALAKLDTPSGQTDSSGNPVLISFFDGAVQS